MAYDKSIAAYQEHTAVVTAVVVYGLANLDHLLSSEGLYADETHLK
jgi:carboxypeptidase Q